MSPLRPLSLLTLVNNLLEAPIRGLSTHRFLVIALRAILLPAISLDSTARPRLEAAEHVAIANLPDGRRIMNGNVRDIGSARDWVRLLSNIPHAAADDSQFRQLQVEPRLQPTIEGASVHKIQSGAIPMDAQMQHQRPPTVRHAQIGARTWYWSQVGPTVSQEESTHPYLRSVIVF